MVNTYTSSILITPILNPEFLLCVTSRNSPKLCGMPPYQPSYLFHAMLSQEVKHSILITCGNCWSSRVRVYVPVHLAVLHILLDCPPQLSIYEYTLKSCIVISLIIQSVLIILFRGVYPISFALLRLLCF